MDAHGRKDPPRSTASLEQYLLMDEKEKDRETELAVARIQKRIHEIRYLLEVEGRQASKRERREE